MQNPVRTASLKKVDILSVEEIQLWDSLSRSERHIASPFLSAHFARAVGASGVDARACLIQDNDRISAFFPFMYESRWACRFGAAQRIGGEMTDSFGIVASSGFQTSSKELLRLAKIHYLSFSHLDGAQFRYGLVGEQPRVGLRALLDPQATPVLSSMQPRYIKDSARRLRKLVEEVGPINFQFDVVHDRSAQLDHLITQKRKQYKASKASDSMKDSWKRDTLNILLNYKFDTCQGVLSTLYAGNHWIASHFGLMGNGILHFWFPVYNPEFSRYAPGRLLFHNIIDACIEHKFDTIDRGEGDTSTKREITNEEYSLYRGVWQSGSVTGSLVHTANRVKWRLGL